MIEAHRLSKRFGSFTAIQDVSFRVEQGEIVGFLGPNGAGKSTTMRILGGVFPPTSGHARIAGYDVVQDSLRARQAIGYFPERVALYTDLTVREYLAYVAAMKHVPPREQGSEIGRVMDRCGIAHMAHRLIGTLSKGYRQRVGIAQALLGQPKVLILDEPTAGLDPEQVTEVRKLIRELKGHSTVILSTHILPEVEATCDRVLIINRGRLLAGDTPSNLNRRLRQLSQIHLEVQAPRADLEQVLQEIPGVISVEVTHSDGAVIALRLGTDPAQDLRAVIAQRIIQHGWALLELRPIQLTLEEIFLRMVHEPPEFRQQEAVQ
ncbi:MAG: multidrug ABC transporter ATP-binding protein [Candidatus Binatia bacterium]|nr:MAG: multidrug ABC transporter ATP-binding protein [Candidatus Binatia bacterium]